MCDCVCDFENEKLRYDCAVTEEYLSAEEAERRVNRVVSANGITRDDYAYFVIQCVKGEDGDIFSLLILCEDEDAFSEARADSNAYFPEDCLAQYAFSLNEDGEVVPGKLYPFIPYIHNVDDGLITREQAASVADALMEASSSDRVLFVQCVRNKDNSITTHYWACKNWRAFHMAESAGEFYSDDCCVAEYCFEKAGWCSDDCCHKEGY